MAQESLKVKIGADVSGAVDGVKKLSASIETLRAKLEAKKSFLLTETDITKVAKYNQEIVKLKAQIAQITTIGTTGFSSMATASIASSNVVTKSFTQAFSAVRTAANILPGIGIAGLIGIFSDTISDLAVNLFKAKESIDAFKLSQQDLKSALQTDSYKKAIESVDELRINIDLAKKGFLDKTAVVNQYNDTLGKTTGQVKTLDEAEQALVKNGDAYVKMMLFKAAANIALEAAAKKAIDAEESRRKNEKEFQSIATNASAFGAGSTAPGFVPGQNLIDAGIKARAAAAKKAKDDAIKQAEDEKNVQFRYCP
jgi:hypothetical protein